jgi:hypothetical protein
MSSRPIKTPPVLADMREVPDKELLRYRQGKELRKVLFRLGLTCFSDQVGSYWFGVADPAFPEHDRWFYRVSFQALEEARMSWRDAAYYGVDRCGTRMAKVDSELYDFVYDVGEVEGMISDVINPLLANFPEESWPQEIPRLKRNALHTFQAFGYLGLDRYCVSARWDQDLHDLVRHPELWAARHPEFEGMPREMVLRMHGLKSYANSLASGGNWLKF